MYTRQLIEIHIYFFVSSFCENTQNPKQILADPTAIWSDPSIGRDLNAAVAQDATAPRCLTICVM